MPDPSIEALALYRLEQDLTYKALAVRMADAGCPVNWRTMHLLLTKRSRTPTDRTRYKIDRFLALVTKPRRTRKRA